MPDPGEPPNWLPMDRFMLPGDSPGDALLEPEMTEWTAHQLAAALRDGPDLPVQFGLRIGGHLYVQELPHGGLQDATDSKGNRVIDLIIGQQ